MTRTVSPIEFPLERAATAPAKAGIDIADYLRKIASGIVSSPAFVGKNELHFDADRGCLMPPERARTLGLIVGELVTNSVKFAHPSGIVGKIEIECRGRSDGAVTLKLADDGVGLPEGLDPMEDGNSGFRLVRTRAAQLGATIAFHSDPLGLSFLLHTRAA